MTFNEYGPDPRAVLPDSPVVVWEGPYLDEKGGAADIPTGRIVLDPDVEWAGGLAMDSHPLPGQEMIYDDQVGHHPKARIEVLCTDAMLQPSWVRTRNISAIWAIVSAYVLAVEARNMDHKEEQA